jgi:hypothetical protein
MALWKIRPFNFFPVLQKIIRIIVTFSLACLAWIFFRAGNIEEAFYIITHLFTGVGGYLVNLFSHPAAFGSGKLAPWLLGQTREEFLITILFLGVMLMAEWRQEKKGGLKNMFLAKPFWFRWSVYYVLIFLILLFGVFVKTPFIYFQF